MTPPPDLRVLRREGRSAIVEVAASETAPARTYRVDPDLLRCDCAAGAHGRTCRHLRFVLGILEDGATPAG